MILSDGSLARGMDPRVESEYPGGSRSRWLRDRLSAEDLRAMVDLYPSGTTAYAMNAAHVTCGQGKRGIRLFWHRLNRAQRASLRLSPGNGRKETRRLAPTLVAGNLSGASASRREVAAGLNPILRSRPRQ